MDDPSTDRPTDQTDEAGLPSHMTDAIALAAYGFRDISLLPPKCRQTSGTQVFKPRDKDEGFKSLKLLPDRSKI